MVAAALAETWRHLSSALPGAWALREGGAIAWVSGVGLPTLNGVWAERADTDPGTVAGLLDRVHATGLPYCLQLRPGASPVSAGQLPGLTLRELSPEQVGLHIRVAAAGFEAPEEPFVQLMTPDVLRLPGVRCYLGETGGQAVTTGIGATVGGCTGVFSVATPPAHRRRGYGAALTARAVTDGLAAGAAWAWLQSSPPGYGIYARLGFRTVETWDCWIAAG